MSPADRQLMAQVWTRMDNAMGYLWRGHNGEGERADTVNQALWLAAMRRQQLTTAEVERALQAAEQGELHACDLASFMRAARPARPGPTPSQAAYRPDHEVLPPPLTSPPAARRAAGEQQLARMRDILGQ